MLTECVRPSPGHPDYATSVTHSWPKMSSALAIVFSWFLVHAGCNAVVALVVAQHERAIEEALTATPELTVRVVNETDV